MSFCGYQRVKRNTSPILHVKSPILQVNATEEGLSLQMASVKTYSQSYFGVSRPTARCKRFLINTKVLCIRS